MVNKKKAAIGVGALAIAAAAAGYYFYASKDAKKNRKIATKWATDFKKDVVKEAKKLKDIDQAQIAKIVDKATSAYESVKSASPRDIAKAAQELKRNWRELAGEAGSEIKRAKKTIKKVAKKVV